MCVDCIWRKESRLEKKGFARWSRQRVVGTFDITRPTAKRTPRHRREPVRTSFWAAVYWPPGRGQQLNAVCLATKARQPRTPSTSAWPTWSTTLRPLRSSFPHYPKKYKSAAHSRLHELDVFQPSRSSQQLLRSLVYLSSETRQPGVQSFKSV